MARCTAVGVLSVAARRAVRALVDSIVIVVLRVVVCRAGVAQLTLVRASYVLVVVDGAVVGDGGLAGGADVA